MTDSLPLEHREHIARLTLHNPPVPTWTPESLRALAKLIHRLNEESDCYGLVMFANERKLFVTLWDEPNPKEGVTAFLKKYTPRWAHERCH